MRKKAAYLAIVLGFLSSITYWLPNLKPYFYSRALMSSPAPFVFSTQSGQEYQRRDLRVKIRFKDSSTEEFFPKKVYDQNPNWRGLPLNWFEENFIGLGPYTVAKSLVILFYQPLDGVKGLIRNYFCRVPDSQEIIIERIFLKNTKREVENIDTEVISCHE